MKYHIQRDLPPLKPSKWKTFGQSLITYPAQKQSYCNRHKVNYIEDAYRRADGRYVLTISSICRACKIRFIKESFNIKS